jgi:hypothetical protein
MPQPRAHRAGYNALPLIDRQRIAQGRSQMARTATNQTLAAPRIRRTVRRPVPRPKPRNCDDCRAWTAFHVTTFGTLGNALSTQFDVSSAVKIPKGKRAVIELVTASIFVPAKTWVSLRMSTSLGFEPSNIDLYLTPQGVHSGNKEPLPRTRETWVATHSLRAYTDQAISFDVSRDYVDEHGDATICVSGYIVS